MKSNASPKKKKKKKEKKSHTPPTTFLTAATILTTENRQEIHVEIPKLQRVETPPLVCRARFNHHPTS